MLSVPRQGRREESLGPHQDELLGTFSTVACDSVLYFSMSLKRLISRGRQKPGISSPVGEGAGTLASVTWLHGISSLSGVSAGSGHGALSPWLTESVSGGQGTLRDHPFLRALRFCGSRESHLVSGVWQVGLADNLRGGPRVLVIEGEVITVSFCLQRSHWMPPCSGSLGAGLGGWEGGRLVV